MYYRGPISYKENKNFSNDDECIWVVYPDGAGGDLLATIINYHYLETGSSFLGINDRGQIIFSPTDGKIFNKILLNKNFLINEQFIHDINSEIGKNTLSYNMLDMVLFSNHGWKDYDVENILSFFKKAKIIRILPKNKNEAMIIKWLSKFKNQSKNLSFDDDTIKQVNFEKFKTNLQDERLFEITFHELFNKKKFENVYTRLIKYLNLPCKLINFDFIEFWLKNQHPTIRKNLELL
jgi:hypothetical protein